MSRRLAATFALLSGTLIAACGGLTAGTPDDKDQVIQKLLDRVDALEREVAALQQAQIPQAPGQQASTTSIAPPLAILTEAMLSPRRMPRNRKLAAGSTSMGTPMWISRGMWME